jgi:hypothetical protein
MTEQPTDSGLQGASDANDLLIPKRDNVGVARIPKGAESRGERFCQSSTTQGRGTHTNTATCLILEIVIP